MRWRWQGKTQCYSELHSDKIQEYVFNAGNANCRLEGAEAGAFSHPEPHPGPSPAASAGHQQLW